ncbi:hypothetical protein Z517_01601 [Fonsecaea pedrosoi CBS 271.37]|uniref:Unplaced genomic scaffold supercont1.1, whole genome shotgun sequence n=1 Tax=Fonsecaea pedrosoi CBS 271.37 TaxID=1442368 RepID=A0A0D2E7U4_9EURO|nr:uncharacterized protein Z517_01601 [Fonsecaea pedrosoi CBS 271.37]KIW86206.1 hypothetical protein Z517_01601 [Fonsecaea pedrosoi CBS 271.37]
MLPLVSLVFLLKSVQAVPEAFSPRPSSQAVLSSQDVHNDLQEIPKSFDFCPPVDRIPHQFPYIGPEYRWWDKTVWDVLGSLEQTRSFADVLRPFDDFVSRLSDPDLNTTVWAAAAAADSAIPRWCQGQALHECLANHISPHWVPTIRELSMPNTPTLLRPSTLNGEARIHISLSVPDSATGEVALMVNRHSRIVQHDIMARNGIIHVVDSYFPPLVPMMTFIDCSLTDEGGYSLIRRAVQHADFAGELERAQLYGATFFVPDDAAFGELDPPYLEFLFRDEGRDVLKTLLRGHLVPNRTLFSNAFYDADRAAAASSKTSNSMETPSQVKHVDDKGSWYSYQVNPSRNSSEVQSRSQSQSQPGCYRVPWGHRQFVLETLRPGEELTVDIARAGGFIDLRVQGSAGNGGARARAKVKIADFLCSDGVVHIVDRVLI